MKTCQKFLTIIAMAFSAGSLFANDLVYMDAFTVYSPSIMGQGGSASAIASGYEALFTNPAGFTNTKNRFTLTSIGAWYFGNPTGLLTASGFLDSDLAASYGYEWPLAYTLQSKPENVDPADQNYAALGDSSYASKKRAITAKVISTLLQDQVKSGAGAGLSLGVGFVGDGLGLALVANSNVFMQGNTFPFGVSGLVSSTVAFIGGVAMPFKLGPVQLTIGGDLRPMIRFYSKFDGSVANSFLSILQADDSKSDNEKLRDIFSELNANSIYHGTGIGFDLGAKLEIGGLTVGLAIRDLFDTRFEAMQHRLGDYLYEIVNSQNIPSNKGGYENLSDSGKTALVKAADIKLALPMTISLGAAFRPNLGSFSFLIDPTIHFDLVDPVGIFRDQQSLWTLLHLGTEIKLLQFIKLRAGINQGYVTLGAGLHLFLLDINASYFTRELGVYAGDRPNSGLTVEAALRLPW